MSDAERMDRLEAELEELRNEAALHTAKNKRPDADPPVGHGRRRRSACIKSRHKRVGSMDYLIPVCPGAETHESFQDGFADLLISQSSRSPLDAEAWSSKLRASYITHINLKSPPPRECTITEPSCGLP